MAGLVALALAAAVVAGLALTGRKSPSKGAAAAPSQPRSTAASSRPVPTTGPAASTATSRPPATTSPASGQQVPAGWTALANPAGRYRMAYPPGWQVTSNSVKGGYTTVVVRDPGSGAYFRVDASDRPEGDPWTVWQRHERAYAASNADNGYRRIDLSRGAYAGQQAATWEFTVTERGRLVHKRDVTFVAGGEGYAVLLTAPDGRWRDLQGIWAGFERAFAPLS